MNLPENEIIVGDCLEVMKDWPDNCVDLVLTDPPYGITSCKWDAIIPLIPMWGQIKRLIKPNCAIVITANQPFTTTLIASNIKIFKYEWIWVKSKCGSPLTAKYKPLAIHENVLVFGIGTIKYNPQMIKGKPYHRISKKGVNNMGFGAKDGYAIGSKNGYRQPVSVQFFQQKWRRQDQIHPTQKPIKLMEYLIKTYTDKNELVLDFACGSGTTCVAAKMLGRRYIGIDISEKYCEIARMRLEAVETGVPVKEQRKGQMALFEKGVS